MFNFDRKAWEKQWKEEQHRASFQKGKTFGIEDETRYQASKLGALGGFPTVAPYVPQPAPKPLPPAGPVSHSPEIKEAKNRVKAYEDDVLSGKVSNDIYGKDKQLAQPKQASFTKSSNDELNDYKLDLNTSQTDAQKQLQNYVSKYLK